MEKLKSPCSAITHSGQFLREKYSHSSLLPFHLVVLPAVDTNHGVNPRSEAHTEEAATKVLRPPENSIVGQPLVRVERSLPPAETWTSTGFLGPKPECFVQSCTILIQRLDELEILTGRIPLGEMNFL